MWRLRLAERFGADIILPELLVNLASCGRRREFTRPMHARFTDLTAQSGYTGSSRGGARAAGDQPPSTMLSDPDTRRLWGARGNHSPHQHESCPRIGASEGVTNLARESRRLAGVNR